MTAARSSGSTSRPPAWCASPRPGWHVGRLPPPLPADLPRPARSRPERRPGGEHRRARSCTSRCGRSSTCRPRGAPRRRRRRLVDRHWTSEGFRDAEQAADYRERARELGRRLRRRARPRSTPVGLEQWVSVAIGGIVAEGRVDRIDRRGDELVVVDYKTGRLPSTADDARAVAARWRSTRSAPSARCAAAASQVELHHLPSGRGRGRGGTTGPRWRRTSRRRSVGRGAGRRGRRPGGGRRPRGAASRRGPRPAAGPATSGGTARRAAPRHRRASRGRSWARERSASNHRTAVPHRRGGGCCAACPACSRPGSSRSSSGWSWRTSWRCGTGHRPRGRHPARARRHGRSWRSWRRSSPTAPRARAGRWSRQA